MKDADVTVFIPVRNGERFLQQAIDSVLGQSYPKLQVVVSDNASTDGTAQILREAEADPRVSYVRQSRDLGMIGNLDYCLSSVATEYYMILCHDDYLAEKDAIERAVRLLDGRPEIGVVYCSLEYVDEGSRRIAVRRFGHGATTPTRELARRTVIHCRNLFGIPLLVRGKAARGKSYDLNLHYAADVDLSINLGQEALNYHFAEPLLANRYHPGNATFSLYGKVIEEMRYIQRKWSIDLKPWERASQHLWHAYVSLQKAAFRRYVLLRSR